MKSIAPIESSSPEPLPELTPAEQVRYSRHLTLPAVGIAGQRRLKQSRVLIVGAGGLGSPGSMYLAAAGVGTLGVVDDDRVDASNLQRQPLHGTRDLGRPKVESARDRIHDLNPHVQVDTYEMRLTRENALDLLRDYDVIVDGTDNFPARYLINDACVLLQKPYVYGSIFRFEGQASVFWAARGACYRCLYPHPPPLEQVSSCAEGGVLGVLPGIIGSIQANETIKLLLGCGQPLINRLLMFDALAMRFRELQVSPDPACPVCGAHPTIMELMDDQAFCGLRPTPAREGIKGVEQISPLELKQRIDAGLNDLLIDVREPHEFALARIPGARLVPPNQIRHLLNELNPARETILFCRSGPRSIVAIQQLQAMGYKGRLFNLQGGMLAWSDQVDPSVPKY